MLTQCWKLFTRGKFYFSFFSFPGILRNSYISILELEILLGKDFNACLNSIREKLGKKIGRFFFSLSFIRNTKRTRNSPTFSNHSHEILSRRTSLYHETRAIDRNTQAFKSLSLSPTILELHLDAHSLPIPFPPFGLIRTKPKILRSKPDPFPHMRRQNSNIARNQTRRCKFNSK